jgi:HD-GYP domain-containing protein (c-di-GMP phosphodiesterase class II)
MMNDNNYRMISVADVRVGMKLAEAVFNKYGNVFIPKGYILDNDVIAKIKLMNIDTIKVYNEDEAVLAHRNEVHKRYEVEVEEVKELLKDIGRGKKVPIEKVRQLSQEFESDVFDKYNLLEYLKINTNEDDFLYSHSINVCLLSIMIGKWVNLDKARMKNLTYAAMLHDVGLTKISPEILYKRKELTEEEEKKFRQHPVIGFRVLDSAVALNKSVAYGVLMHHERVNGSGYPMALDGSRMNEFAKIIAVAECYADIIDEGIDSKKNSPFYAFKIIEEGSFNLFDGNVARVFVQNMAPLYIGDTVLLSNGMEGKVIYINIDRIYAPVVKVNSEFLDLNKNRNIMIESVKY